jgi:hypothetical protein
MVQHKLSFYQYSCFIQDHRFQCADDIDIQMSLNSIKAYWTVPEDMKPYTIDALIAIEQRSQLGGRLFSKLFLYNNCSSLKRGHRGCDRMVIGLTTTCTSSVYHH